jgi:hypothetical protein
MSPRTILAFALGITILCGCTVIRIEVRESGSVEIRRELGIANVSVAPGRGAAIVEVSGLGLGQILDGWMLGYHEGSVVTLPTGRCQLLVWADGRRAQAEAWSEVLGAQVDVCVLDKQQRKGMT